MAEKGPGGHEVGRVSVRVVPNTSGFRRRLQRDLEAETAGLDVDIAVRPDLKNFREKIKAAAAGISTNVDVKAKTAGFRASVAAASKGLTAQVDVDLRSDFRLRQRLAKMNAKVPVEPELKRGALDRLTASLSKIQAPSFGSGINPAGYAAIFAGITAVAAPLFGLLTTALLSLPGLITSIAVPIAAITLGLDGLKKAAGVLQKPFEALKAHMSAVNEAAFTPVFEQLGKIFPTLTASLPAVSQGIADIAKSVVDVITSGAGMDKIGSIIKNIGTALSKAGPGFASFTEGFVSLAKSFSDKLPDLSDWFNGAGKSFSDWVQKITDDGTLGKALEGLGGTLKTLLEGVGGWLQKGFEFMQDPKNIEDFNAGLKSIADSLGSIVTLSNQLNNMGDLFKNLMPQFDPASIMADLTAPFTSEDAGWRGMWEQMKISFQAAMNWIVQTSISLWETVKSAASSAINGIGTLFASIPERLGSAWGALVGIAAQAWAGVRGAVTEAWNGIVQAVNTGIEQVVAFVSALPGKIVGAIGNLGGLLVAAGTSLMSGLLSGIKAGLQSVLDFASGIADKIAAVKGPLPYDRKVLTPAGEALMEGLGSGLETGFQDVMGQAKAMAKGIFEAFQEVFGSTGQGPAIAFNLGNVQQQMAQISTQAADLRTSMNTAMTDAIPSQQLTQDTKEMRAQLDLQQQQLELEKKRLAVEKAQTEDKAQRAAIQAEIDKLDLQKKQLAYQEQQLKVAGQYGDQVGQTAVDYQGITQTLAAIPQGFAQANANQFMSDLGMSGNGALQAIGQYGMDFAAGAAKSVFNFNVSSADEAIAIKNNQINKDSLQYRR